MNKTVLILLLASFFMGGAVYASINIDPFKSPVQVVLQDADNSGSINDTEDQGKRNEGDHNSEHAIIAEGVDNSDGAVEGTTAVNLSYRKPPETATLSETNKPKINKLEDPMPKNSREAYFNAVMAKEMNQLNAQPGYKNFINIDVKPLPAPPVPSDTSDSSGHTGHTGH